MNDIKELKEEALLLSMENAKLRERVAELEELLPDSGRWYRAETVEAYVAEIAKLRELCADMLMCLTWTDEPHGYMEDGCDHCRFKGKTHGMCGLGMFRGRSSELGVEVPE